MTIPLYMALPVVAAIMYAYGSMYFKEASEHGTTVIHNFVVTNWVMALVFVPMIFFDPWPQSPWLWLQPAACAVLFTLGNWLTFAAIRRGDMSIVVPVMGTKAFFVAVGASVCFEKTIDPGLWIAAVLAAIGIYILGRTDRPGSRGLSPTVLLTILGSACFGFADAAIQAWAPAYGSRGFLGTTFLMIGLFSSLLLGAADHPLKEADRQGLRALIIGAGIIALQGILVAISVVGFDNATGVNVVYSSRGLWSVLLIWWIGHRFRAPENDHLPRVFYIRFAGAALMMIAVALAMWESAE